MIIVFIIRCKDMYYQMQRYLLSDAKIIQIRELSDSLFRFLYKSNKHKRKRNKRAKDSILSLALTLLYFSSNYLLK